MFCKECGTKFPDEANFCPSCGTKNARQKAPEPNPNDNQLELEIIQETVTLPAQPDAAPPPQNVPPQQPPVQTYAPPPVNMQQQYYPQPVKKKKSGGLIALLVIVPLVLVLVAGGFSVWYFVLRDDSIQTGGKGDDDADLKITTEKPTQETTPEPTTEPEGDIILPAVSYTYLNKKPEAVIEFTHVDSIFPSNYRMMDSIVTFTGYSDYGNLDVLIKVEIPGFTQLYQQKIILGRQVTKLRIIPPLVTGAIDLNSEKTAQIVYSVTEVESGKLLVQESKNIKLYSKFDMIWGEDDDWDAYTDNILAWMTPDSTEILQLKREAIDYLSLISEGELGSLIGYQDYGYFDNYYYNTWVQAVAIQGAMSDIANVRYNNSLFSMDAQQRVKLPADTLKSKSGLCVETALVMASALQSMGMHVMLMFPPGHAQVAVEAWPGTGDYFLIETTILPMEQNMDVWNYVVMYLDKDSWYGYITGDEEYYTNGPCYVVDCDLGEKLGIRAMSN